MNGSNLSLMAQSSSAGGMLGPAACVDVGAGRCTQGGRRGPIQGSARTQYIGLGPVYSQGQSSAMASIMEARINNIVLRPFSSKGLISWKKD